MKKYLAMILAVMLFAVAFAGCSAPAEESPAPEAPDAPDASAPEEPVAPVEPATPAEPEGETFELAMITDIGTIDDKSFNQGTWEGLNQYATEKGISCKYYKPTEQSNDAYLAAIQLAVESGAKLIATPGFLFEVPIYTAQSLYPEVSFILIDGEPHTEDYATYETAANTVAILYAEHEAGFLAGYALVKDGYTKLGFMGGMAVPAVIRYGYGFVQGAEYAAKEMGITGIEVQYHYTGGFDATPEAQALAASWYTSGTEVIFGCGGAVGNSVMKAAEANNGKVVGVDVDQSSESETVITSSMKGLGASVYQTVSSFYDGTWPGGTTVVKNATNDGVGLPMAASKFNTFAQADYDAIFAQLVAGSVTMKVDTDAASATELSSDVITVTVHE